MGKLGRHQIFQLELAAFYERKGQAAHCPNKDSDVRRAERLVELGLLARHPVQVGRFTITDAGRRELAAAHAALNH